jgi:uncharacterized membrane protein YbhN (UPF0104 family)
MIAAGGLTILFYWFLRTLRWFLMLRRLGIHVRLIDLYLCTAISLSLAIFTPIQSGEALKVELLKKAGSMNRAPGYGSFVLERYLDFCAVILLASVSLSAHLADMGKGSWALYLLSTLAALVAALMVLCQWQFRGRLHEIQQNIIQCINDPWTVMFLAGLTFLGWAVVALGWRISLQSLGIEIDLPRSLALMSVITIINILSFIPGAVGISEAGIAGFLLRLGKDAVAAQAGALIIRCYGLLIVILGVVHLVFWRRRMASRAKRLAGRWRSLAERG